ncbi:hypothetical protein DSECCO2_658290 [anaerobic digester metagenome]
MDQRFLGDAVKIRHGLVDIAQVIVGTGTFHQFLHIFHNRVVLVFAQFKPANDLLLFLDALFGPFQFFFQCSRLSHKNTSGRATLFCPQYSTGFQKRQWEKKAPGNFQGL